MNERIIEIAEQSYVNVPHERDWDATSKVFDKNKFAELLLNECIDVVIEQKKWVEDQEVFNPRDEFWNRARIQQSQHIMDKIKQHFGIEK